MGWTPLHFAALLSNLALVEWMLEEGSDALATGKDGCVPGDCAAHPEVRIALFKTGAHSTCTAAKGHGDNCCHNADHVPCCNSMFRCQNML
jgi:ankyrin repeat protein